jgi:hypothetical protein
MTADRVVQRKHAFYSFMFLEIIFRGLSIAIARANLSSNAPRHPVAARDILRVVARFETRDLRPAEKSAVPEPGLIEFFV